jgi:hypothetical protein
MKGRLGKTLEVMESGIPSDTKLLNSFVVGRMRSGVAWRSTTSVGRSPCCVEDLRAALGYSQLSLFTKQRLQDGYPRSHRLLALTQQ